MTDQPGDILAAGHVNWLPLPLDSTPEAVADELRARYVASTPSFALEATITALAGAVEELSRPPDPSLPVLNLAAWVLLEDPTTLEPGPFAVLRAMQVAESTTEEDATAMVVGDEPTYQDPVVEPIDTRSGPAVSVRVRPMVGAGLGQEVHQRSSVYWLRAEQQVLYVVSTYATDLVQAAMVFDRLEELAAGIEGL